MVASGENNFLKQIKGSVVRDARMEKYTSFRVGGPADVLIKPRGEDDIKAVFDGFDELTIIGAGSNLLVSDDGIRGAVLRIYQTMNEIEVSNGLYSAGAGCKLSALVAAAGEASYLGLEWAVGIPGTVGGAVMMNAGAFGSAIWQRIEYVRVISREYGVRELTTSDVNFTYRKVDLNTPSPFIVSGALFKLERGEKTEITRVMTDINERRHLKQPLDKASAGSVFKNPRPDISAGRLIERAGLKGVRCGGASVSTKHANFIVNDGNATANDIYTLIQYVKKKVAEIEDIELQIEIKLLGDFENREGDIELPR